MTSQPLDAQLSQLAKGATVDVRPVLSAPTVAELAKVGGDLILTAKGQANLSAVQLAMRTRAAQLADKGVNT